MEPAENGREDGGSPFVCVRLFAVFRRANRSVGTAFARCDSGFPGTDTGPLQLNRYQGSVSNLHQSHAKGSTQAGLNKQPRNDGLCSSPRPPSLAVFITAYYLSKNVKGFVMV